MAETVDKVLEARLEHLQKIREAEIAQQARGGKQWWASFELLVEVDYEGAHPHWISGYGAEGATVVFAAIAQSEDDLKAHVESMLPEGGSVSWRFVQEREAGSSPFSDRFQGPHAYMVWPTVPLMPMDEYLEDLRSDYLLELKDEQDYIEELRALSATEVIRRALVDSGALYEEEAEEVAGGVAKYLSKTGKLTSPESESHRAELRRR